MANKSTTELAYSYLKEAILSLELKPQEPLRTQSIAAILRLSRTPIREALGRLEQEGFVLRIRNRGYVVRSISMKEAMDLYEMRELLESRAVRAAALGAQKSEIAEMRLALKRAEASLDKQRIRDSRDELRTFNQVLASATGNSYLSQTLIALSERVRWLGSMITSKHSARLVKSIKIYKAILRAIQDRDPDSAEKSIRLLITSARDDFVTYVVNGGVIRTRGVDADGMTLRYIQVPISIERHIDLPPLALPASG